MDDGTREEISIILEMLKVSLMRNGVSMGLDGKKKAIVFFDTETYMNNKKLDGFRVCIDDLVK